MGAYVFKVEVEQRSPVAVDTIPAYVRRDIGGHIPLEVAVRSVGGVITPYGKRAIGGTIPEETPTQSQNGVITVYGSGKAQRRSPSPVSAAPGSLNTIAEEIPTVGKNGQITPYGQGNNRK